MASMKMARVAKCHRCPYRRSAHADFWRWPHCVFGGGDRELSDEFMAGPEASCPAGYWKGLQPVAIDLDREKGEQMLAAQQARAFGPVIAIALRDRSKETVADKLEEMVAEGYLTPAAAVEIALEISR